VKFYQGVEAFFGVDGQGRLLMATQTFQSANFDPYYNNGVEINDALFVFNSFSFIDYFGVDPDKCMVSGDSFSACGTPTDIPAINGFWQQFNDRGDALIASGKNPDMDIVRP